MLEYISAINKQKDDIYKIYTENQAIILKMTNENKAFFENLLEKQFDHISD
ncbi:MAG TPA: hypothetical protein GXZ48_07825 [Acholeplasmataceae bacterium]|nr:hypothetical protein [Acholeplasmataceae bacterium]